MISALYAQIDTKPFTETDFEVLSASAGRSSLTAHTKQDVSFRQMHYINIYIYVLYIHLL